MLVRAGLRAAKPRPRARRFSLPAPPAYELGREMGGCTTRDTSRHTNWDEKWEGADLDTSRQRSRVPILNSGNFSWASLVAAWRELNPAEPSVPQIDRTAFAPPGCWGIQVVRS